MYYVIYCAMRSHNLQFLGGFAKLRKSDYKFHNVCLSVRLLVLPNVRTEQPCSHWTDHWNVFRKSVAKNSSLITIGNE